MFLPMLRILFTILIGFGLGLLAGSSRRNKFRRSATPQSPSSSISQPQTHSETTFAEAIAPNSSALTTFETIEIKALEAEIDTLKQANQQLNSDNATLSHQYTKATHNLTLTQQTLGETQQKLEAKQLELDRYVDKFDLDKERQELELRCTSLEGTVAILQGQVTESREFVECLKLEKQDLKLEKQSLEQKLQELYQQIEEISHYGSHSRDIKPEYQKDFTFISNEGNLYSGEKKDLILRILTATFEGLDRLQSPRRYDILKDILENNQSTQYGKELRENLSDILRGFKHLSKRQKQALESFGFEINEGKDHYNMWLNGDRRYRISLAKTPSDRRAGLNAVRDFLKVLL